MCEDRMACTALKDRIMSAGEAAAMIKTGMTLAVSGFGPGNPKTITQAVADRGEARDLSLIAAVSYGEALDGALCKAHAVRFHTAFQDDRDMRRAINTGEVAFCDCHLSHMSDKLRRGQFGKIDFTIIEVIRIGENGELYPVLSAGLDDVIVELADHILVEINSSLPTVIDGLCDFGGDGNCGLAEHQGTPYIACSPEKIAGIVFSEILDPKIYYRDTNEIYDAIAANTVSLLKSEVASGRLPENFTFQSGMGGVANAVLKGIVAAGFKNLKMYTELMADTALCAMYDGVIAEASATALSCTLATFTNFCENIDFYRDRIAIRPLDVTNNSSNILRQELIAMNTAVEADIYGNINSSHVMGIHMINGLGGSGDFARNAKLTIFSTPSTAKSGAISSIVPMCAHVDSTEHDVDIIVTEQGYADLRGLSPKERVAKIIDNCAHPDYRQQLWDYYNGAVELCGPCQTPHDLTKCLSWYQRYFETGTMKE
jgi:succinyl-CoA:acetate CoA-transferase